MSGCSTGIIDSMLGVVDDILEIRDDIGAVLKPVYFVTRNWYTDSGLTIAATQAEGYAKDSLVQLLPSPGMKQFNQDVRLREGGAIKAGDIILTSISREKFVEADLDGTTSSKGISKFYLIGDKLYQVINVTEKYLTFDVQVRELTNQTRY